MTRVADVMAQQVITADPQMILAEVARRMKEHDIGALPVVGADGRLLGIVTDRDIVVRALSEAKDGNLRVADVMTPNPVTITPDRPLLEAAKLMAEHQIRRLIVVEGGRVVGMLSVKDLAETEEGFRFVDTVIREVSETVEEHGAEVH